MTDHDSGRTVRLFDHRVSLRVDVDTPLPPATGEPELVIAPAAHDDGTWLEGARPRYVSPDRMSDGRPRAELYQVEAAHIVRFATGTSFRVSTDTIDVAVNGDVSARLVTMQLLGPVMSLWLERRGVLTLHGAAVRCGSTATGLIGPKGSGKSTLAAVMLGRGHALICDDALAIDVSPALPSALSSYPEIRLWPGVARRIGVDIAGATLVHAATSKLRIPVRAPAGTFTDAPAPLSRVYLLQRDTDAADMRIEAASRRTALVELLRHSFSPRLMAAAGLEQRRLPVLAQLVEGVEVRVVHYAAKLPELGVVAAAIEQDAGRAGDWLAGPLSVEDGG